MSRPRHARESARAQAWREGRERGEATVGMVIGFPIAFFIFVVLAVQVALIAWSDNAAQSAALAAVREARVEGGTDGAASSLADSMLEQAGPIETFDVVVERGPDEVQVTVTGEVTSIVPFWSPSVSHTASGPLEVFVEGAQP